MALFGKKPSTLEEVRKAYENLSDDDKKEFQQSISDRLRDDNASAQEQDAAETDSRSAESSDNETLDEEHLDGEGDVSELQESDAAPEEKQEVEEPDAEADEGKTEDNRDAIIEQLSNRVGAIEQSLKEFGELKERMEDYTRKQAESFGLNGHAVGGKKNFDDMSADELKTAILNGQN